MTRQRVLFITTDPLTDTMPGPAIRAWHLAEELSADHEVALVSSVACTRAHPRMEVGVADPRAVEELYEWASVVVGPGSVVTRYPCVGDGDTPLVVDIYDPYHLENLASPASSPEETDVVVRQLVDVVNRDLRRGDFFLCASERQRDFWIGSLTSIGRVNARTHLGDERLDRLLAVVPFGVPSDPPSRTGPGLGHLLPADRRCWPVVLWGGGVYEWLDPVTLLQAVGRLRGEMPDIFLVFMGMGHPNPEIPPMPVAGRLRAAAEDLGMGPSVAFNSQWVPYEQRGAVLLDATVGVSTNLDHLEARYSFRTRVLDYLWAGLPTVMTAGDVLSGLVEAEGVGVAVPPGDVDALAEGIRRMATAPPDRAKVRDVAQRFRWDRVARPLQEYCAAPWRAADRAAVGAVPPGAPDQGGGGTGDPGPGGGPRAASWRTRLARAADRTGRRFTR